MILRCLFAVLLVCALADLPASAQEKRPKREQMHRHIYTRDFPIPDFVVDPKMRAILEDLLRRQGQAGQMPELTPQEREKMFWQLQQVLSQFPKDGRLPDSGALKGLEGYQDLLESYRRLLEAPATENAPGLEGSFYDWMDELTRELQDSGGERQPFDLDPAKGAPLLTPEGAEFMRRWLSEIQVDPDLRKQLNQSLSGVKDLVRDVRTWWRREMPKSERNPRPEGGGKQTDPVATDAGGKTGAAGLKTSGLPDLPGLSGMPALPVRELVWGLLLSVALGLAIYALWLLWTSMKDRLRASLARWRVQRPRLPEAFAGPEAFFQAFAETMSFLNGRAVEGRTHRELARGAGESRPALLGDAGAAADLYEELYYDRRVQHRAPELCRQARAVLGRLVDAVP